ncbi:hypothetical protein IHE44_0003983 [Lamprotornis superbus]|uniref:Uncharacterized protein n=1 Tax=Lamprotornis superbus TaxID=245042 RepID=A0A835NW51_9PASS|nr:hypothetical protein IHE44_0003983 [Lamprotornis superbus]
MSACFVLPEKLCYVRIDKRGTDLGLSLTPLSRVTSGSHLDEPRWEVPVHCQHTERGYLQSMVRHSLLSLHEAPMGLRDTPLQKGVILRCRGLRGWLRDRDTPWVCNRAGLVKHPTAEM